MIAAERRHIAAASLTPVLEKGHQLPSPPAAPRNQKTEPHDYTKQWDAINTDSMKTILDRYQLEDPAIDNPDRVFTNPDIQAPYDNLVAQGSESLIEGLKVGALIEDLDIFDLQSLETDTADIALLYANLEKGSRNHLRAFISNLDQRGGPYTPVYLTPDAFEAIISTPAERGPGG